LALRQPWALFHNPVGLERGLAHSAGFAASLLVLVLGIRLTGMKLRLVVEFDPESRRWAAFFPELPGCASAGDTEEEAVRNAWEALELWFEPSPVPLAAGAKVLEVPLTWANVFQSAAPRPSHASSASTASRSLLHPSSFILHPSSVHALAGMASKPALLRAWRP
jgi:predicted RNase H-like HicB family nuclease